MHWPWNRKGGAGAGPRRRFTPFLVLFLASGGAWGASLEEAVRDALARYPEVRGAAANVRASEAERDQARSGYFPSVDWRTSNGPDATSSDSLRAAGIGERRLARYEEALTLRQMIYDGAATGSEVDRTEARIAGAQSKLEETRDVVALQLAKAWLDLLSADAHVVLARGNEATHEDTLAKVRARLDSGIGSMADVQQAEARLALARSARRVREGDAEDARTRYRRLAGGLPSAADLPAPPPVQASREEARQDALRSSPTLLAAKAEVDAALAVREGARAAHLPRLDLEFSNSRTRDTGGVLGRAAETSAQLVLRYNLFRGGGDQARIRQAEERRTLTEEAYENARRAVEENVDRSWVSLATLEAAREDLRAHARASAQVLDAYRDQFTLGRRSLLDLLNGENEHYQARAALIDNDFGVLAARYRLLSATGRLLPHFGLAEVPPREGPR